MGSKRINGSKLKLTIGGTSYVGDLTSWKITNEDRDKDVLTFEDAAKGNARAFNLELELVQSTDPESLFMKFWDHTGEEADYQLAPHGNEEPSSTEPYFVGTLVIPDPPEFGGDAGPGEYKTSATAQLTGKPRKVTNSGELLG